MEKRHNLPGPGPSFRMPPLSQPQSLHLLLLMLMLSGPVCGQIPTGGPADPHVYKTIEAEEDWSFLTVPALRSWFIPLSMQATDSKGEIQ